VCGCVGRGPAFGEGIALTETEWEEAHDPLEMLEALRDCERQRDWHYVVLCLDGIGERSTADLIRRVWSGEVDEQELSRSRAALTYRARRTGGGYSLGHRPLHLSEDAQKARAGLAALEESDSAERVTEATRHLLQRDQCSWLRCLYPNPFRCVAIDPSWLTSDVRILAEGIYSELAFDRMPILADALQDAGCDRDDILGHCRGPGPHVCGCWAVDFILGKE
jgi:hypothetical protein